MNELNYSSDDDEVHQEKPEDFLSPITDVNFVLKDYGQNHPDWLSHTKNLMSGGKYSARVLDFLQWQQMKNDFEDPEADLLAKLKVYIEECHVEEVLDKKLDKMVRRWAPTVFRPWMSMFYAFWKFSGK
jgi:hypothetical protein